MRRVKLIAACTPHWSYASAHVPRSPRVGLNLSVDIGVVSCIFSSISYSSSCYSGLRYVTLRYVEQQQGRPIDRSANESSKRGGIGLETWMTSGVRMSWLWRSNGCGDQYVDLSYHNPLLVEAVLKLFLRTNPIPCEDHGLSPGALRLWRTAGRAYQLFPG